MKLVYVMCLLYLADGFVHGGGSASGRFCVVAFEDEVCVFIDAGVHVLYSSHSTEVIDEVGEKM